MPFNAAIVAVPIALAATVGAQGFRSEQMTVGAGQMPLAMKAQILGDEIVEYRIRPSTRHAVASKLRNGDLLHIRRCRMRDDERWCDIRATDSGVSFWETAAPRSPDMPEGGPTANDFPFDVTRTVPCATDAGQPSHPCPFGVIRGGPGNSGVWIPLGDGAERHILFAGGSIPVATDARNEMRFGTDADIFVIRVGEERYELPDAVVKCG